MDDYNVRDISQLTEQISMIDLDYSMEDESHQRPFDLYSLENCVQEMSEDLDRTRFENESTSGMSGDTAGNGFHPMILSSMNHELQGYFDSFNFGIDDQYYPSTSIDGPSLPPWNFQLNQNEINSLRSIDEIFYGVHEISLNFSPQAQLNSMRFGMECLATFSRRVPAFREISETGQTALVQSSIFEILIIQAATRCCKIIEDQNLEMWILNCPDSRGIKPDLSRIFGSEIMPNGRTANLLILTVLFSIKNGHVFNKNDSQIVNEYYHFLINLLKRYLESLYASNVDRILNNISESLEKVNKIAKDMQRVYSCYEFE